MNNLLVPEPSGDGIYVERILKDARFGRFTANGKLSHIRYSYEKPKSPEILSQKQPPRVVEIFRGDGDNKISVGSIILTTFQLDRWIWAKPQSISREDFLFNCKELIKHKPGEVAELVADRQTLYIVSIGLNEQALQNIVEEFYFGSLPPEAAAFQNEQDKMKRLAAWVLDLLEYENREELKKVKAEGNARAAEQLFKFPRRLRHESPEMDHYKNRNEVMVKLLHKEWPRFFEAMDKLKLAKTEAERIDFQRRVVVGYQADHKALFGTIPELEQAEAAKLSRDDHYLHLMSNAMNATKEQRVPKIDWQLVSGWIEKNYYRMKDKELGTAFARDWNNKPSQHKGNTLAKRAREIGLLFARQRGRPEEKPNLLPPG